MANMHFKADLLPNSDLGYSLGSNDKRWKLYAKTQPLISKVYANTNQYATEANSDKADFYFMSVRPDSFVKPWTIKFKIRSFCPNYPNGDSITYCTLSGRNNSMIYHNWNERYESGHYYICSLNLTQAGFNAGLGHAIGISILYGWNYTNANYYRTFEVDYYDCDNCTVSFLDAPVLKANWPSYNTTNYSNHNHYNAIDRGLIETGDYDTTGRDYSHSGYLKNGATFRLPPNSLFGLDRNNNVQSISLYSSEYTSSTTSVNTARVYNTAGFDWTKGLYYSNSGSNYAKSADLNFSPAYFYYAMDLRYSDNCVAASSANTLGLVMRKPVYLRGVIKSDGLFYLAPLTVTYSSASYKRAWTQDLPTAVETDGTYQYVYWFIGWPYYNSSYPNSGYQVNLHVENKLYWYNNGRFEEYSKGGRGISSISRNGTTYTVTRDDGTTFTFTQQDNNTWRGIQDNLTSDSATDSLSAKQGKALANGSARDSTKLPLAGGTMTGAIKRYYSAASTDPVLSITSNDKDVTLFNIGHGTAAGTPTSCWYRLVYKGTGSSPNNTLQLIAAKNTTESTAVEINEDGMITFNGTGIFKKTTDAAGTVNNSPALIIGGTATQAHIEIDANEIMAKGNGTTTAVLYLNNDGGEVQIGGKVAARVTSAPTSGQVMIADGTGGLIKSSGYTIAKSVPSNAVFTDTNNAVAQTNQTGANDYRILLSGSADDTPKTEGTNKSTNLRFNPSTKVFSVGGDINATGDLTITGNTNLNSETYAESITAGSLLVNGAANFVNIPTAPTPVATSNDTSIATTAFVMNAFTANDAMVFKGVINANSDLPADYEPGWTYRIGTAGEYENKKCEVGDIIIGVPEGTTANNDHWAVIQNNIDGAVYKGANAFTDAHVIIADSTAGKVKDSGKTITATAPSSSAANTTIPTSKAVWSAISGASGYGKTGTVTSITAGTGLNTTSNNTATDGGSITSSGTLYLTKTGVTAGSYGPSAAVTGNEGTTMNVPYITVDKYGRVTSISNKTYTAKNTTYTFTAGTSSLSWNTEVTLATVGGLAIKAKLPTNPNSNTTYTFANGSDGSFTVTPSGGSAQKVTIGKPATAGTADVANSVAWGSVSGKPSTFPPSSHTHLVTEITQGNAAVAGSLDPLTQSLIGSAASNKSFGLPAEAITIEYSTNGGSTWTDYGATDTQKKALFSETRSFNASLGKATTAAANSVNNQLRITIEPTDRYTSFNGLYIWMSTSGNTVTVDLERSTIGAKNTFTSVFTGQSIAGWSGNNIRYFTYGSFGGGSTQTSNNYKYRLIFKQTAINSNYASASINDIRFLGLNVWSSPNNMVSKNHLYTWNENLDATFPAQITATAFNGNASSSSAVKDYNNSTLTEFGYSTSGMGSTSWLGSWDASTSGKYRLRAISPANAIKSGIGSTAIGAAGTPIYWNGSNFVAGNAAAASGHTHNYLPLSGGTLSGDLSLKTGTADSPDIVWYYGDTSKEQARIWMGSGGTTKFSPLFRCYKSDGTSLYSGNLVLGDGTGASGTWGISITGSAGSATKATQDESGNNIKASYAASFSISDHTITLKNKNGASLGTVTIPDNNTVTTVTTTGTGNAVTAVTATNGAITVTKGSTFVTSSGVTSITAGTGLTTTNGGSTDGGSITTSGTFYLTKSGATAGSYGPSANVSGSNGTTMNVPYITVDAYGRVTSISNKTYTSVNTEGTDTKNTAGSTDISTKIFLVGAASQTASAQTYSDNQVYATNGQLDANKLRVAEHVTLQYNTTTNALDFVFV